MFERVYTVYDYWDYPRSGIADCSGDPYFYDREFDNGLDEFSDIYILTPIDQDTLSLALEKRDMWLKWKQGYGQVEPFAHPALQNTENSLGAKFLEIGYMVEARVAAIQTGRKRAKAEFRVHLRDANTPMSQSDDLEVEWSEVKDV